MCDRSTVTPKLPTSARTRSAISAVSGLEPIRHFLSMLWSNCSTDSHTGSPSPAWAWE